MKRYIIDFSYSGHAFHGYQAQPGLRTVQAEIEKVLSSINDAPVKIHSSGRTDAKANALHQVAHFDLNKEIQTYKIKMALNSYLPDDIYVNEVKEVSNDFHARYMVKSKTYEYSINLGIYNPLLRTHVYQYGKPLNISEMKEALKYFLGTHDFTTFTCAEDKRPDKIRTIYDAKIKQDKNIITLTFTGNGFLKYQIRNMVGLLIKVGEEKVNPSLIPELFDKKDRRIIGNTAPACGLTLVRVEYK